MGLDSALWRLVRPDAEYVWRSKVVNDRLKWYKMVMDNKLPAKFLLARRVPLDINPKELSLEELWEVHGRLREKFLALLRKSRLGKLTLKEVEEIEEPKYSFLDVKAEIAWRMLSGCRFCERRCGIDRRSIVGTCGVDSNTYVSTYFLHMGEEAPLVPSGTIFYGGCNFKCVYCQNYDISQVSPRSGMKVTPTELAAIQEYLRFEGARNINHVGGDPTPNIHTIISSLKYVRINVPQLWNSNMYLTEDALKLIIDLIDIWLPDFKYGNNKCGERLSKVSNYFDIITRNLSIICKEGDPIIIRHLVLPNHIRCCTEPVLKWIATNCKHALVNVMAQYRPEFLVLKFRDKYKDISRRPNKAEMSEAYALADELGLAYREIS